MPVAVSGSPVHAEFTQRVDPGCRDAAPATATVGARCPTTGAQKALISDAAQRVWLTRIAANANEPPGRSRRRAPRTCHAAVSGAPGACEPAVVALTVETRKPARSPQRLTHLGERRSSQLRCQSVSAVLDAAEGPLAGLAVVPRRNRSRSGNTTLDLG